ncbi:MAG: 3'(2'),5'-bisphosphate nucleotidase CysQ [Bacteroidales bacterium]|nr:3'(2'),5'-bisphosphate nucleotidase CysQ [Bacteroidales bacterium]
MSIPDPHPGVIALLTRAGKAIMDIYCGGNLNTTIKDDSTPVTAADLISEKIISEGLQQISPAIPVIGEESYASSGIKDIPHTCWILDPLDGTKEFIKQNDEFAICLALMKNRVIVEGYIYAPVTGTLWWAIKNKGAARIENGKALSLPCSTGNKKFLLLMSRSHHTDEDTRLIKSIKQKIELEEVYQGSAIKFGRIAEGSGDLYIKSSSLAIWDVAAGTLILNESGGGVISMTSRMPLCFNSGLTATDPFMASGSRVNDPLSLITHGPVQ